MVEKRTIGDILFDCINVLIMLLLMIVTLAPFWHVLMSSLSSPYELVSHSGLVLWPMAFAPETYKLVFDNPMLLISYRNTFVYVICGTSVNIFMTTLGAYVLSRKGYYWKKFFTIMIMFTMFFSGGLVPFYLNVISLNLRDTIFALILPGAISTYNLIIMRTAFESISPSLEESARIDGATDITILYKIMIPLSMPTIAVMILFYGVGHWNSWFNAMLFMRSRKNFPLQLILREILILNDTNSMTASMGSDNEKEIFGTSVKYATIIVATIPILLIYPFLQKYFVKGVMIGAVKE